jgi:hypothetical protein
VPVRKRPALHVSIVLKEMTAVFLNQPVEEALRDTGFASTSSSRRGAVRK